MSQTGMIRLSAVAVLIAGASLFATAAQALPPGAAPPWAGTAPPPTEAPPPPTAAVTPAPEPSSAPPAMTPASAPATSASVAAYPASGTTTPVQAVFLRAGPNTGEPVIGTLQPGMPLQVLASANYGWMEVQSPVGSGWVYGSYLAR